MTAPIVVWCMRAAGSGHITVDGADNDLRNALAIAWHWVHRDNLEASPWHHEPV